MDLNKGERVLTVLDGSSGMKLDGGTGRMFDGFDGRAGPKVGLTASPNTKAGASQKVGLMAGPKTKAGSTEGAAWEQMV